MIRGWRRIYVLVLVITGALTSSWNATQSDKLRVTEIQLVTSRSKMTYYGFEL